MDSSKQELVVAAAVDAFASELPVGKRRRELKALVQSLERPGVENLSPVKSRWTTAFERGLELRSSETALSLWMDHASRESRSRSRRTQAWTYPVVMAGLVIIVMLFAGPLILQPFSQMFDEFGLTLPYPTLLLLYIGEHYFGSPYRAIAFVAVLVTGGYLLLRLVNRYSPFSRFCNWFVAGNSVSVSAMASFTGMLSHLLSAGVPLADALQESGNACGHNHLASLSQQLSDHVREDRGPLINARAASRFPRNVIYAIEPRPDGASNIAFLRELSSMYEERVAARQNWTGGAVGLFGMFVVGFIVFFIVFALFLPLIELISGLT